MTSLKTTSDLAIPLGSLILLTGATGYIGSNVVREALDAGFRVRGTARTQKKCDVTKKVFRNDPNYETAIVADMGEDGAYDDAVKGVDAIIHVASVVSFSPNPDEVIKPTVNAAVSIMRSALKEPSVKRFVYTSSSSAATLPKPNTKFHLDKTSWNAEADAYVHLEPPYKGESSFGVYAASKTKAEQAVWQFVKDNNPQFVVNAVLPDTNFGRILDANVQGITTSNSVISAFRGELPLFIPPQYMIDVVDDARIHVAAAIDKTLANERIYAFDSPFNWTDVLAVLKELRPKKKLVDAPVDEPRDISTVDNELGAQLLTKWWGQDGYVGLKKSIEANIVNEP